MLTRANPISPIIIIRVAAARPTQIGNLDRAQGLHQIAPPTPHIRHFRFRPHPQTVVNTTPQMLRKMAEDVPTDNRTGLIGSDLKLGAMSHGDGSGLDDRVGNRERVEIKHALQLAVCDRQFVTTDLGVEMRTFKQFPIRVIDRLSIHLGRLAVGK